MIHEQLVMGAEQAAAGTRHRRDPSLQMHALRVVDKLRVVDRLRVSMLLRWGC